MRCQALMRAGLASLTLALAIPVAPAAADSIAYVKGGDVWLATPDGARQVQVTRTGGYASVSQADDGTMIALAPRERLHRLSRTGQVLADFPTFVSDGAPTSGPVNEFHGPFAPEISPDGKLVAFEWFNESYENGKDCTTSSVPPCQVLTSRQGVGITRADGFTGFEEYGLMTGWIAPSWTSDTTLLRSGPSVGMNEDAVFTTVGPGRGDDGLKRWFWDERGIGVDDVELTRDGHAVVGIAGFSDEFLRVYRPLFDPANAPAQDLRAFAKNTPVVEQCAEFTGAAGGRFETPTFAPSGRGLAWAAGDGVHATTVPDLAGGCAPAQAERLVLPGARSPDWGPADVPAAAAVVAPGGAVRIVATRTSLAAALQRGLAVTVRGPAGARVSVAALVRRGVAGSGNARLGSGGAAAVRVRFSRRARRTLVKASPVRVTLKATLKAAGAVGVSGTTTVTLR